MNQDKKGTPRPRPRWECNRVVTAEQQVRFLLGIRNGLTVKGAAGWARVGLSAIYWLRRTDASFAELWAEAFAGAKADTVAARAQERAAGDAAQGLKIARDDGTLLKRKRRHATEFTPERKQEFLDHFADCTNMAAAAAATGITTRAVRKALAEDAAFAEGFDVALTVGYKSLEADTLSQQQQVYRLSADGAGSCDAQTFERSLQLLKEYRRPDGKIGRRASRRNLKHVSKEELVEQFVKAMGQLKQRRALLRAQGKLPPKPGESSPDAGPLDC